jgi:alpha-galactosidase/6-phospho-beta-glucosidase family protein
VPEGTLPIDSATFPVFLGVLLAKESMEMSLWYKFPEKQDWTIARWKTRSWEWMQNRDEKAKSRIKQRAADEKEDMVRISYTCM